MSTIRNSTTRLTSETLKPLSNDESYSAIQNEIIKTVSNDDRLKEKRELTVSAIDSNEGTSMKKIQTGNKHKYFQKVSTIEATTARFFGFHGLAYYTAQITSNLLSFFILQNDALPDTKSTFNISCGSHFCNAGLSEERDAVGSDNLRYLLSGVCLTRGMSSALLVLFLLEPLEILNGTKNQTNEAKFSIGVIFATLRHCRKKEQLLLIPLSVYSGMYQGFYTADFTKSYKGCAWSTAHVGLVSAAYGLCCALSSTATGLVVKHVGRVPVFVATEVVNLAALAYLLAWRPDSSSPAMFCLGAGLLGMVVGSFWSQLQAFYGVIFKEDEEAAFASYY